LFAKTAIWLTGSYFCDKLLLIYTLPVATPLAAKNIESQQPLSGYSSFSDLTIYITRKKTIKNVGIADQQKHRNKVGMIA